MVCTRHWVAHKIRRRSSSDQLQEISDYFFTDLIRSRLNDDWSLQWLNWLFTLHEYKRARDIKCQPRRKRYAAAIINSKIFIFRLPPWGGRLNNSKRPSIALAINHAHISGTDFCLLRVKNTLQSIVLAAMWQRRLENRVANRPINLIINSLNDRNSNAKPETEQSWTLKMRCLGQILRDSITFCHLLFGILFSFFSSVKTNHQMMIKQFFFADEMKLPMNSLFSASKSLLKKRRRQPRLSWQTCLLFSIIVGRWRRITSASLDYSHLSRKLRAVSTQLPEFFCLATKFDNISKSDRLNEHCAPRRDQPTVGFSCLWDFGDRQGGMMLSNYKTMKFLYLQKNKIWRGFHAFLLNKIIAWSRLELGRRHNFFYQ